MLKIETKKEGDTLIVALEGHLDTLTTPSLKETLDAELPGMQKLVLDFEKLDYVSSAGLRILQATDKKMMSLGGMEIRNVCELVQDAFEVTGLIDILTIV